MQDVSVPRTLLIAAHPDDETIGAAIRISRTPGIRIVHVTEGSPANPGDALAAGFWSRESYAAARRQEAFRAVALANVPHDAVTNLCFIDQNVAFELESLTVRLLSLFEQLRPEIVLTHAYEGGHPDHDSVAFACHSAKRLFELEHPQSGFQLLEFTSYHADAGGIVTYEFLSSVNSEAFPHVLTAAERQLKISMLREFTTQQKTLEPFMQPEVELFRPAPGYDFRRAPHLGRLFYEYFDWGIDGATWRDLAQDAQRQLLNPIGRAA
jgi:LmbE family N-acetylglucosaminyl deacetylase